MGVNTNARRCLLPTASMNRGCHLCLESYDYRIVKRYAHGLQLCGHCHDVLTKLSPTVESNLKQY